MENLWALSLDFDSVFEMVQKLVYLMDSNWDLLLDKSMGAKLENLLEYKWALLLDLQLEKLKDYLLGYYSELC